MKHLFSARLLVFMAVLFLGTIAHAAQEIKVTLDASNLSSYESLKTAIDIPTNEEVVLTFTTAKGYNMTSDGLELLKKFFTQKEEEGEASKNFNHVISIDLSGVEGITTLPAEMFMGCQQLTTIKLPALTELSTNLFKGCTNLTTLTIGTWSNTETQEPLTMATIPAGCFQECSNLKNLFFEKVKNVGGWAFSGCIGLTRLPIMSVEKGAEFGQNAFENTMITGTLSIPDGTTKIAGNCFLSNMYVTSIALPSSIESVDAAFVNNCQNLKTITVSEGSTYFAQDGILYNKVDDNGTTVQTLVRCPMAQTGQVNVFNGTTHIGNTAFLECKLVTGISLNDALTHIGSDAFNHCEALTTLQIPESVTSIESNFINHCSNLATLKVTDGNPKYITINNITYAKGDNKQYTIFRVPEAAEFDANGTLKIDQPASSEVIAVGSHAFYHVKNLKVLQLPDDVKELADECFKGCGIQKFIVPQHLTVKGFSTAPFSECDNMTAFEGTNLDEFTVNKGILFDKEEKKLIKLPNGYDNDTHKIVIPHHIQEIQPCAFEGTQNIKTVELAQGTEKVPHRCFYHSKIENVLIPNSVIEIGQDAFSGSTITRLDILTTTTTAPQNQNGNYNSFYGINGGLQIHLSDGYGNFKDAWTKASNDYEGKRPETGTEKEKDEAQQKDKADSQDYGWLGMEGRMQTDIKHRAIFELNADVDGGEAFKNVRNELDNYNTLESQAYDYITLYRDFSTMKMDDEGNDLEYATLALPVSLSKATLLDAFGPNTKIYEFTGRKNWLLTFKSVKLDEMEDADIVIKKGVAVLIQPEYKEKSYLLKMNLGGNGADRTAVAISKNEATSFGADYFNSLQTTIGNENVVNGQYENDATFKFGFYATYQNKAKMPAGSYYMKTDGTFMYAPKSLRMSKALRGFIKGNDNGDNYAGSKYLVDDKLINGIDGDISNGIEVLPIHTSPSDNLSHPTGIYTLSGQRVSPANMTKGVYIINGKKCIVK